MEEEKQENVNEPKKKKSVAIWIILAIILIPVILFSMIFIGLGAIIVNNTTKVIKEADMESSSFMQQEIATYNSIFSSYEGTGVSGTTVKQLLSTVRIHNQNQTYDDMKVDVYFNGIKMYDLSSTSAFTSSSKYNVSMSKDSDGRINRVDITSNL